ncbi:type II toxin-antitoxin system PemK/MazF family toxin [Nodosilinea sp. AN01ver1]|uniref:type II toxin-antitoxin system PemK/MazF family toxin n=1 Tax=Nodosilinea sp. AN01ver1 TaxID=3423362 RepID=UPI003D31937C
MTYRQFDVVVVPFPFTDVEASKRRPALVLSADQAFNRPVGHSVMAMITTASHSAWALDVEITDLKLAGLKAPSIVRMKLFTLDHALVRKQVGRLSPADQAAVIESLASLLPLI